MDEICEIVGEDAGVNCGRYPDLPAASLNLPQDPPLPPPIYRFQAGSIDEVSFVAPDLGPLAGILVGVVGGTWEPREIGLVSSRSKHVDRFVCRQALGEGEDATAKYLVPVPAGSVMYGQGQMAKIVDKATAQTIRVVHLEEYQASKSRVILLSLLLMTSGSGVTTLMGGTSLAKFFLAGGVSGLLQYVMLSRSVDGMVDMGAGLATQGSKVMESGPRGPLGALLNIFTVLSSNFVVRLAVTASTLYFVVQLPTPSGLSFESALREQPIPLISLTIAGFFCTKVALLAQLLSARSSSSTIESLLAQGEQAQGGHIRQSSSQQSSADKRK